MSDGLPVALKPLAPEYGEFSTREEFYRFLCMHPEQPLLIIREES